MSRALLQQSLDILDTIEYDQPNHFLWEIKKLCVDIKEELAKPDVEAIGQILDDNTYHSVSFDKRIGRAIWFKSLNEFHDGASLYASPPQPKPLTPSDFWNAAPWQPMETAPVLINMNVFRNHIKPILGERMDKPVVLRYINNSVT